MAKRFTNRQHAGRQLADRLLAYSGRGNTLVLALPRGGVPVAFEIAAALCLPMDVLLVRKLGVPGHEELAMGAIAQGDVRIINQDIVEQLDIQPADIERVNAKERDELLRRNKLYRAGRPSPQIEGRSVIVADDGLATGATMRAAISALRQAGAANIIVAVPVGARSTCKELKVLADELICLEMPEPFCGVGRWYKDFSQTSDVEVQQWLQQAVKHNTGS